MINIKRLFFVFAIFAFYFTSENCNAQKINQYDSNDKRTGVWKKYHPNKRIRYVGKFKNGKEIGVFKFYDTTNSNQPVIVKTFSANSDSVFVKFYSLSGKIETEGALIGRNRVGNWNYFYKNGKTLSQENYINGKLHGEQITYYPDGKTTELSVFKNGLKHGKTSKYSSKGILIEEVEYKNGKSNGVAKYFELNGNLKETGTYKDDKRVGKWEYYLDGELASEKDKKKKSTFTKKN